jgi:hypothetical protein
VAQGPAVAAVRCGSGGGGLCWLLQWPPKWLPPCQGREGGGEVTWDSIRGIEKTFNLCMFCVLCN